MMLTLADLAQNLIEHPRAEFLVTRGGAVRYGELASLVDRFCAAFSMREVAPGDRIVIQVGDDGAASACFIAALLDGIVPVMLSPDAGLDRIGAITSSVDARMIVTDKADISTFNAPVVLRLGEDTAAVDCERGGSLKTYLSKLSIPKKADRMPNLPTEGRKPRCPTDGLGDLAYILFTSGTTSEPRGVQISRRSLLAHLTTLVRLYGHSRESRIFNPTPMSHTDGLVQGPLLALAAGGALVRPEGFGLDALEKWLDFVRASRATHMITTPTVLTLVDRYAASDDYFDASEFKGILSSAAILHPDLWDRLQTRFQTTIWNAYGMTETVANALYAGPHPEMGTFGTIGRPVDCQARIGGPDGIPLPQKAGQEGELQLSGENIFGGYWRNEARTRESLDDGWMCTGDLVRLRDDGSFDFLGRCKTVINQGGTTIRPEEIDECLLTHPMVVEAVTVGMPDADFEEVAVSVVVLSEPVSDETLATHCRSKLEPLKTPKRIIVVERIPRGDSGKPNLTALREMLSKRLSGAAATGSCRVEADILKIAARLFQADIKTLTSATAPDDVPGWDSFTHLNLIIEAEAAFGLRIPAARVAGIRTLGALVNAVGPAGE